MNEIQNSALLSKILECAERLCQEKACSGLTRDYIVVAALKVISEGAATEHGDDAEFEETRKLIGHLSPDRDKLEGVLNKWQNQKIPMTERMILSTQKGRAMAAAKSAERGELPANIYLYEILREETPGIKTLHVPGKISAIQQEAQRKPERKDAEKKEEDAPQAQVEENLTMADIVKRTRQLQATLQSTIFGQSYAVSAFVSGYFQSELSAAIDKQRKRPRSTFLFAGPPGVGKTFLAEEAARILELPFQRFDMSEYTGPAAVNELSGSDANYIASTEGLLTNFVKENPKCILLFDEIEKASLEVIHLFLQVLDAGRLRDNRTDKEISFKDAMLIFTTNAGKTLYEGETTQNLSALPREVVLDALATDINPRTGEPFFPAAICSRLASGNVMMFNRLDAYSLRAIVENELDKQIRDLGAAMDIAIEMDERVPTALLLAEGANADARTVKSRANAFFGGELYELFRLLAAREGHEGADRIRSIRFTVNSEGEDEAITRLFAPSERLHALAYTDRALDFGGEDPRLPILHLVNSPEEARKLIDTESIELLLCDLSVGDTARESAYLNLEDRPSPARDFLNDILKQYPSLPVVLLESKAVSFSDEEKISYERKGVRGFLSLEEPKLEERIGRYTESIFRQNSLVALGRSNRVVRYETAQSLQPGGEGADIVLFDMKLEKAVKAGDANDVLSMLSTPDVKFDDVIGAEDAKRELKYFVSFMRNPKKYRVTGVSAPKGVLLYGPPGTGKTMLAKAFAAESGATFIATEGNQFFKGVVGAGSAMVHRLFATARRYAPAVLFIDEIDAIARARTGRDTDMAQDTEQILTAMFAEMDGFSTDPNKPVFVLGATNYSAEAGARLSLDAAMLRRFDRRVLIDLPTLENRALYLKNEIAKKPLFDVTEKGIDSLANRSTGMSLAQLSSILDMAIRMTMQRGGEKITDQGLDEAFETFNNGEERKWDPETTLRTARHEAGHTLVSWLCGEKPAYVTIVSRGNFGGYMRHENQEHRMEYTRRELTDLICVSMGGRAAEIVYYGAEEGVSTGASGDLVNATRLAKQLLCAFGMDDAFGMAVIDPENSSVADGVRQSVNCLLKRQLDRAVALISGNRDKVDRLVDGLMKANSLNSQDIDDILSDVVQ